MAKQPRTKLSGKEARYVLKQNNISLAWLAEQLGIKAQSLQSRLNSAYLWKLWNIVSTGL